MLTLCREGLPQKTPHCVEAPKDSANFIITKLYKYVLLISLVILFTKLELNHVTSPTLAQPLHQVAFWDPSQKTVLEQKCLNPNNWKKWGHSPKKAYFLGLSMTRSPTSLDFIATIWVHVQTGRPPSSTPWKKESR